MSESCSHNPSSATDTSKLSSSGSFSSNGGTTQHWLVGLLKVRSLVESRACSGHNSDGSLIVYEDCSRLKSSWRL